MFDVPLDMKFEDKLIKDYAKEIYEDFLSHANRRELEPDYVVNKFILELQSLGRKNGYIGQWKAGFLGFYGRRDNILGEIRKNNKGTEMKIIRYNKSDDIDVMFLDEHSYVAQNVTYLNFKRGQIKNPFDKSIYGIGYLGDGDNQTKINGKRVRAYNVWHEMIARCCEESRAFKYSAYYGICTVCQEWLCYNTFADWYEKNKYECEGRLHLDKDILYPGNKVYSPYTCLLVPQYINVLFINKTNQRGLPNGIIECKGGYLAKYDHKDLGIYNTVEEAYRIQTNKKKEEIIKIANEKKLELPNIVYEALLNYEFSVENDRNYVA